MFRKLFYDYSIFYGIFHKNNFWNVLISVFVNVLKTSRSIFKIFSEIFKLKVSAKFYESDTGVRYEFFGGKYTRA